jgi:dynein heavy chain
MDYDGEISHEISPSDGFRLYLATRLSNPHLNLDTAVMLSVVNFSTTIDGLSGQLLQNILRTEAPHLEEVRLQLADRTHTIEEGLHDSAVHILSALCDNNCEQFLEYDDLIDAIQMSEHEHQELNEFNKESKVNEEQMRTACKQFQSVAAHGALLYSVVQAMADVNPLYTVSLADFTNTFLSTMSKFQTGAQGDVDDEDEQVGLESRYMRELKSHITYSVFKRTSRGLFS